MSCFAGDGRPILAMAEDPGSLITRSRSTRPSRSAVFAVTTERIVKRVPIAEILFLQRAMWRVQIERRAFQSYGIFGSFLEQRLVLPSRRQTHS